MTDSRPYIISFCSGKSGVGKSIIAANIANVLSKNGVQTLLVDSNSYSPTLHLLYGVEPYYCLNDFTENKQSTDKIAYTLGGKLQLIAGKTSPSLPLSFDDFQKSLEMIITNIESECIIFDCNSGANNEIIECCSTSDIVFVVLTDEPSSVIDGYGFIKIIQARLPQCTICLIINNVIDIEDAEDTTQKLNRATLHFLESEFDSFGFIPYDRAVKSSIIQQRILNDYSPNSGATVAIRQLSTTIEKLIQSKMRLPLATYIR